MDGMIVDDGAPETEMDILRLLFPNSSSKTVDTPLPPAPVPAPDPAVSVKATGEEKEEENKKKEEEIAKKNNTIKTRKAAFVAETGSVDMFESFASMDTPLEVRGAVSEYMQVRLEKICNGQLPVQQMLTLLFPPSHYDRLKNTVKALVPMAGIWVMLSAVKSAIRSSDDTSRVLLVERLTEVSNEALSGMSTSKSMAKYTRNSKGKQYDLIVTANKTRDAVYAQGKAAALSSVVGCGGGDMEGEEDESPSVLPPYIEQFLQAASSAMTLQAALFTARAIHKGSNSRLSRDLAMSARDYASMASGHLKQYNSSRPGDRPAVTAIKFAEELREVSNFMELFWGTNPDYDTKLETHCLDALKVISSYLPPSTAWMLEVNEGEEAEALELVPLYDLVVRALCASDVLRKISRLEGPGGLYSHLLGGILATSDVLIKFNAFPVTASRTYCCSCAEKGCDEIVCGICGNHGCAHLVRNGLVTDGVTENSDTSDKSMALATVVVGEEKKKQSNLDATMSDALLARPPESKPPVGVPMEDRAAAVKATARDCEIIDLCSSDNDD